MKIIPLGENLLIKPLKASEKRDSGLVVPESDKGEVLIGEVIGRGLDAEGCLVVGKKVAYAKYWAMK